MPSQVKEKLWEVQFSSSLTNSHKDRETKRATMPSQVKEKLWDVQFSSSLTNSHKDRCQEGNCASSSKIKKWKVQFSSALTHSHKGNFHLSLPNFGGWLFYTCTCIFTKTHHFTWTQQQALSCKLDKELDVHLKIKRKWKFNLCKKNTEKTLKINWYYGSILLT